MRRLSCCYGPLHDRIARIELALCLYIDNQLDHLIETAFHALSQNVFIGQKLFAGGIILGDLICYADIFHKEGVDFHIHISPVSIRILP